MELQSIKPITCDKIELQKVNLLVGPNNSGKSRLLRDIHDQMIDGNTKTVIIEQLKLEDFRFPTSYEHAISDMKIKEHPEINGISKIFFYDSDTRKLNNFEKTITDLKNCEEAYGQGRFELFHDYFKRTRVLLLDASSRLTIANSIVPQDPRQTNPLPLIQAFAEQTDLHTNLQDVFRDAFGMELIIDYYTPGLITFKISETNTSKDISLSKSCDEMSTYMRKLPSLDDQGDGFKSFVGIVISILSCKNRIILIDEPEAFLHSSQAKVLGRWIVEQSQRSSNQIILATHSPDFLDSFSIYENVNILRLDRNYDNTRLTQLKPTTISKFRKDPILSNLPMLESVFYHGVILCEGDRDRIVYRAVHRKKINQKEDVLFINTNGKQGIKNVVPLLTETEIKFKVIVDFDFLLDKALFSKVIMSMESNVKRAKSILELRNSLEILFFGESETELVTHMSRQIIDYLTTVEYMPDKSHRQFKDIISGILSLSKRDQIKQNGLKAFESKGKAKVRGLLNECKRLGLYLVPYGEIESFIPLKKRKEIG